MAELLILGEVKVGGGVMVSRQVLHGHVVLQCPFEQGSVPTTINSADLEAPGISG